MNFLSLLKSRHSVKSFKEDNVPSDKIKSIFEGITLCPTYKNLQEFKALLITDINVKEKIENIIPDSNSGKKGFIEAPLSIVVAVKKDIDSYYSDNKYYMIDGSIVMYNILLSATSEGLGSCWVEVEAEEEIKSILNIPSEYKVIGISPIGFPEHSIGYVTNDSYIIDKKDISEVSYESKWNNKINYF